MGRSNKRTDFRALKARRDAALARPEIRGTKIIIVDEIAMIEAAVAAGRVTKVAPKKRKR
jgi:hypothetical protein